MRHKLTYLECMDIFYFLNCLSSNVIHAVLSTPLTTILQQHQYHITAKLPCYVQKSSKPHTKSSVYSLWMKEYMCLIFEYYGFFI